MSQGDRKLQLYERVLLLGTAIVHDTRMVKELPIVNVSEGGIFLSDKDAKTFEKGTLVTLTLRGTGFMEPLQLVGKVIREQRHMPKGLAVEFTAVSSNVRRQLSTSIEGSRIEAALNRERKPC